MSNFCKSLPSELKQISSFYSELLVNGNFQPSSWIFSSQLICALKEGEILTIDEFDARLHPLISLAIVKLFNSQEANPNNAQLIFMTHDTNLLSNKIFRRDQIWFTEKNRYGATDLHFLAEYKIRNDASFESDYIKGRYGAIPYTGNLNYLIESQKC